VGGRGACICLPPLHHSAIICLRKSVACVSGILVFFIIFWKIYKSEIAKVGGVSVLTFQGHILFTASHQQKVTMKSYRNCSNCCLPYSLFLAVTNKKN
jgi:hypothetical protein